MSVPTEQEPTPAVTAEDTPVVAPVVAEPVVEPAVAEPPVAELPVAEPVVIPVATPAPLAAVAPEPQPPAPAATAAQPAADTQTSKLLGLPLQLVNQLLARLGAAPLRNLADLLPALRLLSLLVVAGITLKLTGATLGAINELPLVGRLLELVGLISALQFVAANALRSQKRAELLARIQKLKRDFLG
jgi:CAAD domains of cyanobacterial aminoacyl-tRNA synthetase